MIEINNFGIFNIPPAVSDTTEFNDFAQIARTLTYRIPRFNKQGDDLSPYTKKKLFYGSLLKETNKLTKTVVFSGTVRNVFETKRFLDIQATEPLVNYFDFVVETVEYEGALLLNDGVQGTSHLLIDKTDIPVYSKIRFPDSAQEYLVKSCTNNTIEITPPLQYNYAKGQVLSVLKSVERTPANSIKTVFLLAGISENYLGSSFDFYDSLDSARNLKIFQNLSRVNNVTLRDYLTQMLELSAFRIFTRNGKIEISRLGDYYNVSLTVLDYSNVYNVRRYLSFDKILYGYYLPYKTSTNTIAFTENYVDDETIAKYDNTAIFAPVSFKDSQIQLAYNSQASADYIGLLVLDYYKEPKTIIECNVKYIDHYSKKPVILYVGDGVNFVDNEIRLCTCRSLYRDESKYEIKAVLEY